MFQEVLDEIMTNPANFAAECGVAVADCFVPGGVMNATDYLFGDKSANEALDAAGPDLVMTVFGASIAKGGAKAGTKLTKVSSVLKSKYHTKLTAILKDKGLSQPAKTNAKKQTKVKTGGHKPDEGLGFKKELAKDYVREIEKATGYNIPENQRLLLKKDLQQNKYVKLQGKDKGKQRRQFRQKKDQLREEWSKNTGREWPTYKEPYFSKNGKAAGPLKKIGDPYDAHEIIPNSHGGPLKWWNVHPARFPDQHQKVIHGKEAVLNKILKDLGSNK